MAIYYPATETPKMLAAARFLAATEPRFFISSFHVLLLMAIYYPATETPKMLAAA